MQLVIYPDERLRAHNRPLFHNEIGRELKRKANEMIELMESSDGAGLAAPQVGINQTFFVVAKNLLPHQVIINPRYKETRDAKQYVAEEGCLSFPGLYVKHKRFDKIHVQYQCVRKKLWEVEIDGFAAHVFQHEADHLDGRLMIDNFLKVLER